MWFERKITPQRLERIRRKLSRGRPSFIWRYGVLGWGVPVFLMITAWDYFDRYRLHKPFESGYLILHLVLGLPIWIAGGYWAGTIMWRRCNELLETNQS
jgi:hypothetical protein